MDDDARSRLIGGFEARARHHPLRSFPLSTITLDDGVLIAIGDGRKACGGEVGSCEK
jgi:hypothetical protein